MFKMVCCNIVKAKDWKLKLHECTLKRDPDKAILFNCKKGMNNLQNVLVGKKRKVWYNVQKGGKRYTFIF